MSDKAYFPMPDLSEPKPTFIEIVDIFQIYKELIVTYFGKNIADEYYNLNNILKAEKVLFEKISAFGCNHE